MLASVLRGLALLTLAAVASATAPPLVAQAPAAARGLIWEVEREGRTGWLVGSLHVLTSEHYPLPDPIEAAFRRADTLVEEVDIAELQSPQAVAAIVLLGFYREGETLDTQIPAATWALVRERAERLGVPLETVRRMRPWMAGLTLVSQQLLLAGFDPEHGIDNYFRRKATEANLAFQALETAEQQLEYLAGFSPAVQEQLLRSSLEDADRQMRDVQALVDAWTAGDTAGLERLLLDSFREVPEVYQTLIVERNRRWMPRVDACLQRGNCFIVVGAGHMVGDDGLVAMLRQQGYRVRQI